MQMCGTARVRGRCSCEWSRSAGAEVASETAGEEDAGCIRTTAPMLTACHSALFTGFFLFTFHKTPDMGRVCFAIICVTITPNSHMVGKIGE